MMRSADIAKYLVESLASETEFSKGEVAVMVQGMGGTSNMEKFIFYKDVSSQLANLGLKIRASFIGEYTPSMEMAGVQLTILKLDEEIAKLLEEPTEAPGWHAWS
jgi:dihydroxyacetone kinase-like protein